MLFIDWMVCVNAANVWMSPLHDWMVCVNAANVWMSTLPTITQSHSYIDTQVSPTHYLSFILLHTQCRISPVRQMATRSHHIYIRLLTGIPKKLLLSSSTPSSVNSHSADGVSMQKPTGFDSTVAEIRKKTTQALNSEHKRRDQYETGKKTWLLQSYNQPQQSNNCKS